MSKVLTTILLALAFDASAQVGKLYPVDAADEDVEFYTYRMRLIEAVAARNTDFVVTQMDENIKLSFGGMYGADGFKKVWQPEQTESGVWPLMALILGAGGTFQGDGYFEAPYWSAAWPDTLDPYEHGAIIGNNVNVRSAPNLDSEVLAQLSYDLVKILDPYVEDEVTKKTDWAEVELDNDTTGYVWAYYVKSAIDYRIGFEKVDGRWRMKWFLAGD